MDAITSSILPQSDDAASSVSRDCDGITPMSVEIRSFDYNPAEFSLDHTVASGQCFRWKRRGDGWWVGVVGQSVLGVRQEGERFSWWSSCGAVDEALVRDYFQLDTDL